MLLKINPDNPEGRKISQVQEYTQQIDNPTFKLLKRNLPGAFTFILPAAGSVPKMFRNRKKPSVSGFLTTIFPCNWWKVWVVQF